MLRIIYNVSELLTPFVFLGVFDREPDLSNSCFRERNFFIFKKLSYVWYENRHTLKGGTAQWDNSHLTQHFFSPIINSVFPRGKCLSKGLSKHTLKTSQILLHHNSSINLVVNSLFIYGTLKRSIWIMWRVTERELYKNNKMTTTPKPPEGTCQHIASLSSCLFLSLWASCSAGSHTCSHMHTHTLNT